METNFITSRVIKQNDNYVPETLTECRCHYVPPVKEHIHCHDFGKSDGTNGSCWWCMEMTPYQWHMCKDETWVRGLLSPCARVRCADRTEAIKFIENYNVCNKELFADKFVETLNEATGIDEKSSIEKKVAYYFNQLF
jgi:hypothetical protein